MTFDPDWCIRPGLTLQDVFDEIGLPMKSYAEFTGLSMETLHSVLAGAPITESIAEQLAKLPGGPRASMWLALERNYREGLAAGRRDVSDD